MPGKSIKLVETPVFHKLINEYLSPLDCWEMQEALGANPIKGSVIRGTGGMRKVRWNVPGKGKSGGLRIIYHWDRSEECPALFFLFVYKKSVQGDLSPQQIAKLIGELEA